MSDDTNPTHRPTHDTCEAYDLTRQARWEVEGFRRAAAEYERARAASDPGTLPSGQRLLREVVPGLTARILEGQMEALRSRLKPAAWHGPVQLLPPETLALLTTCEALRGVLIEGHGVDVPVTWLSFALAASVQDELHFRTWIKEHKAARKEDGELRDLYAAFKREYPTADRRAWNRWKRKLNLETAKSWDNHTRLQLGSALLHWLVEAAPHRFEKFERREDGKTKLCLRLSAETVEQMNDLEQRKSLARPRMMPMLIKPRRWEYADE